MILIIHPSVIICIPTRYRQQRVVVCEEKEKSREGGKREIRAFTCTPRDRRPPGRAKRGTDRLRRLSCRYRAQLSQLRAVNGVCASNTLSTTQPPNHPTIQPPHSTESGLRGGCDGRPTHLSVPCEENEKVLVNDKNSRRGTTGKSKPPINLGHVQCRPPSSLIENNGQRRLHKFTRTGIL